MQRSWLRRINCLAGSCLIISTALATERPLTVVMADYVAEAQRSNLALQAETYSVQAAQAALQQARARYLPELSFSARYTVNQGGRELQFPIGDLLNPVYRTLNDMLLAQGGAAQFSMLENQNIPLLRPIEQDTYLSVRQPLYAPAITAGVRAQQALFDASQQQRLSVERQLQRDVRVAYLNWLQAQAAVQIVSASQTLLSENLRINELLFTNGKVTEDQPLRARAELLTVEQQLRERRDQLTQAQSYVNFLLNRALDTPLETASAPQQLTARAIETSVLSMQAMQQRAELQQLAAGVKSAEAQIDLARAEASPTLSLGVDAGIQGDRYGIGSDYNYASASVLLNWKFYAGGGLQAQVTQAKATARRLQTQREQVAQQITLQVQRAVDGYRTAFANVEVAQSRAQAARAALRIAERKRDEGVINQVEFLDARNALTTAELNLNVTRFAALQAEAELDYVTATIR